MEMNFASWKPMLMVMASWQGIALHNTTTNSTIANAPFTAGFSQLAVKGLSQPVLRGTDCDAIITAGWWLQPAVTGAQINTVG